ncbi:MAG: sulfate transporter family protein [Pseudomonadota bacterium]
MIIESARLGINEVFAQRARWVVLKAIGLTILLFFGVWLGLQGLVSTYLLPFIDGWTWLTATILWLLGAGVVIGGAFLLAPVTAIFAGIFLDDVARFIEAERYPQDMPGQELPLNTSLWLAFKFMLVVLFVNLLALLLVILPGVNFAIFFFVNGYLLGREYFQFAAMRFHSEQEANQLRKKYGLEIFLCGLIIAGLMAVPILNLLTPVFAAAMMVHFYKSVAESEPVSSAKLGR